MKQYKTIKISDLENLTLNDLIKNYNDLVETIWYYQQQIEKLVEENDQIWAAYEDVSDELYGQKRL